MIELKDVSKVYRTESVVDILYFSADFIVCEIRLAVLR